MTLPAATARLVATLIACLVLQGALACRGGPDLERLSAHRERGAAAFEAGRYREAILEYRSAVQIDPDHAETHFALARAYAELRHYREAYWEIEEAIRLDPTHVEARIRKAQVLTFGDSAQKQEALDLASSLTRELPENSLAWLALGIALGRLDRLDEAVEPLERALELEPDNLQAIEQLAWTHSARGDRKAAEPFYQRRCDLDPHLRSFLAYTRFLAQDRSRDEDVVALMKRTRDAVPRIQRVGAYALYSDFLLARERYAEAEEILRKGIGAEIGSLHLFFKLARVQAARGDREAAEATMDEAVETKPYDPQTHLEVALFRREQGDVYGALAAIDRAIALDPEHREARMRRAELRLEQGHGRGDRTAVLEAEEEAREILAENPSDPDARLVMGKAAFAQGDYAKAAEHVRGALDVRGDWGEAYFVLGSMLYLQGDLPGARAELANALRFAPFLLPAERLAAKIHARLGDDEEALKAAVRTLRRDPRDTEIRVLLAQSLLRLGHVEDARIVLKQVPEEARHPAVDYALARVALQEGDRALARERLMSAHRRDGVHFPVLRDLLELDREDDRIAESVDRLRIAATSRPEDARLVVLRARAALYAGETGEAERLLVRAIETDPDEQSAYLLLGSVLAASGRTDEVIATYEAALARAPDSPAVNMLLGSLYEQQGRVEDAIARYERAVAADTGLGAARNNLAQLLAENGDDLERALELAQQAKALLPEHPLVADTLGWVLYRKGVPGAGSEYLAEAERGLTEGHPALGEVRYRTKARACPETPAPTAAYAAPRPRLVRPSPR